MASYNQTTRELTLEQEEEYKNKMIKDKRTIIELSPNHYISVKDYNGSKVNELINNAKHRTNFISTRERLLKKLENKKLKE